jgi:hypothetical protein
MSTLVDDGYRFNAHGPDLSSLRGDNLIVEDYLETLTAPMVGLVPYRVRFELRAETAAHLERQIDRLVAEGIDRDTASQKAIAGYGSARAVGDAFLEEWYENQSKSRLLRRFGHANYVAFGRFAIAQAIVTALLQIRVFLPSGAAYSLPLSPAEVRRLLPEPLPIPEASVSGLLLILVPLIAPWLAGISTGYAVPVRPGRAVYQAMLPIVIYSFFVGALMLPMTEGLLFALFQVVYWIPSGAVAAHIGMSLAARRRNRTGGVL